MRLSIIIPMLNEAAHIAATLRALQALRNQGVELIVVDGGSQDASLAQAQGLADQLLQAPRGRACQMNTGAAHAHGQVLLFLHADTQLPTDTRTWLSAVCEVKQWGRFDVQINGPHPGLAWVARLMNLRSRLTGIATGDQALFVRRADFQRLGGYADLALMEDIELTRRLRAEHPPLCLRTQVQTSGRRWLKHGLLRTIIHMWWLRWRFFCGADARQLARAYGYQPRD